MLMNDAGADRRLTPLVFALGFLLPLTFALITNHAWEDWYITYRASKNLALGNGLVYTVGERVHSFTSPIGTLIPSALNFITGNISDDLVLWLFRIFNCVLIALTAVMLLKMAQRLVANSRVAVFLLGMFLLDAKILDFSINGMETAFMVFFLTLTLYAAAMPLRRPNLVMGLAWGGLMWTRPDSFVYIIGLGLGFLIFCPGSLNNQSRVQLVKNYCIAGAVAAVVYAPWLIWAWSYYGSFVPHTVTAKGLYYRPFVDALHATKAIVAFPVMSLIKQSSFESVFLPGYAGFWDWPAPLPIAARTLAWMCAFAWVLPFLRSFTRALSFAALIVHCYFTFGMKFVYPWYVPGATLLSIIVLALLIDQGLNAVELQRQRTSTLRINGRPDRKIHWNWLSWSLVLVPLVASFSMTSLAAYQVRIQQEVVEDGNRKQLGMWLRDNASSLDDRVFLEPLGYIGFYSNLKMYDYPGLSSPEVVAARRTLQSNSYSDLIGQLRPEWVVLRPHEAKKVSQDNPGLLGSDYSLVKSFDVSGRIASYTFLPGRRYLRFDQTFLVFHRKQDNRTLAQ